MALSYDYYPAVLYAIDLIGQGYTRTKACDMSNITVSMLRNFALNVPEVNDLLVEAEERCYDAMADALVDIGDDRIYGERDPKMAKVISENIKWLASKRKPKDYGQKITVDHNITADKAIIEALNAGAQRAMEAAKNSNMIEHVIDVDFEEVKQPV